jgi:hypothetical protein
MYYTTAAKNTMLGALGITQLSLHTGNPGTDGTSNEYSGGNYARRSCTFDAAADGKRKLSQAVVFSGTPDDTVSWLGFWSYATFRGAAELDAAGDNAFDTDTGLLAILAEDTYYGIDECT